MANGRAVITARAAEVPVGNEGVKPEILEAVCKLTGLTGVIQRPGKWPP